MSEKIESRCLNCNLVFFQEKGSCPRCNSKNIVKKTSHDSAPEAKTEAPNEAKPPEKRLYSSRMVYGDTKTAWQSFHSASVSKCPHCGSTEFENDFKHKQKFCKKCGEIVSLRRRPA